MKEHHDHDQDDFRRQIEEMKVFETRQELIPNIGIAKQITISTLSYGTRIIS